VVTDLFRREVYAHRQQSWIGGVQTIRPLSLTMLTALVVLIALAVGAFLGFAQYTKKARVNGFLAPDRGVLRLLPPLPGTVTESHVREGQRVRAGDVLFVLSPDLSTRSGDTQIAVQRSLDEQGRSLRDSAQAQSALVRSQRVELERRIADMQRELEQMGAEAALVQERLVLAQQAQARVESLKAENFVSQAQVQAKAEDVLAVRAQLATLERQRAAQRREISALQGERAQLPLRESAQREQIERELQQLERAQAEAEARHRIVVRAPQDAVVSAVLAEPGQTATPGVALASLVPAEAKLQAHLYAPSSAVGFVAPQQPVLLRYQAFPYQKFGHQAGRIVAVSRTPLQSGELASLPLPRVADSDVAEPLYRITVELDRQTIRAYGDERALAPGMQLEADVLLDRRRLIEWIFEPVISVTGRV
jgi:membrane fusion protein